MTVKLTLDDLVTSVATDLMGVTAATLHSASERLLHQLVDYFEVDLSFLRRNDHERGATILVAEWPPREDVPADDPLGVIYFADADPTFAALETLSSVLLVRPAEDNDQYQDRVRQASGIQAVSLATVPLMDKEITSGSLGFIKYGDRAWEPEEINALRAVAALLAQLQARVAAEERLRYLAYHDELTGLATRRALTDHLAERLSSGAGPVPVIFIDVDRLKALNSFLGHAAGDQFLATLAHRLKTASPANHMLARLGGDEFVAVMERAADEAEASRYADTLRRVANEPVQVGGEEISRAISIGLALGEPGQVNVSELMNQADQAMLQAKSRGGNEIAVFTDEMRRQNEIRTDIELHLVTAIRNGSLLLHYQPEVDMFTGEVTGIEALVRWPHPNLGLLPPAAFIEVIETTNLAGELGRWVLETGCRQLREWHRRYPRTTPLGLSVNVTPAELITRDFVSTVAQILRDSGLEGQYLTLEITEKAIVRDTEQALDTLRGLKNIGVRVAIDDFGTGYSSLAQLKSLPVDVLKIDRGFVRDLGVSADDLAIVRSIVGLAGSFGLRIVAEGVETKLAAASLLALGCTRAQGFLYAKPCGAEELGEILAMGGFGGKRMS
ncbi:putative bifunctional diguanylate cyclase/phosphodiesterase [Nakamurella endophytica]|uniref:Bifunctional diguanylate cyclase/phosphodiesterase n=1 Tax=Nakamurella endophytica TaxID=1748367 RepID=A0A917SR65_9ACTN|nr:bifunctional diguanylate cyclase/phosphodiesterase [Nakamurella endophytica]GGL91930.1 bifunctional diguanylate cyclase/phosphodiesterase [Nakamurella endophytica]